MDSIWTDLMGLDFRQTFYNVKGVKTRAIEAGQGKPLVFLHGAGGHAEAYARNIAAHAKHFHVYSIDMIGHGYTDCPNVDYKLADFVEHVKDFIDTIGGKVLLSGESLGGMTTEMLACKYPDRVEKIVLNTGLLGPRDPKGTGDMHGAMRINNQVAQEMTRDVVRARLAWLMRDPAQSVTDELVEVRYKIYSQPGMAAVIRKVSENTVGETLRNPMPMEQAQLLLKEVKCPVFVLWTKYNPGKSAETAFETAKLLTNKRVHVLQNSAHWPQWEEPEEFNRVHLDFLLNG